MDISCGIIVLVMGIILNMMVVLWALLKSIVDSKLSIIFQGLYTARLLIRKPWICPWCVSCEKVVNAYTVYTYILYVQYVLNDWINALYILDSVYVCMCSCVCMCLCLCVCVCMLLYMSVCMTIDHVICQLYHSLII